MMKKNRVFTVIITILILVALLSSAIFIATQADHHCTGAHCSVCVQIHICQSIMHLFALVTSALGLTTLLSHLRLRTNRLLHAVCVPTTLITCKIKLSN